MSRHYNGGQTITGSTVKLRIQPKWRVPNPPALCRATPHPQQTRTVRPIFDVSDYGIVGNAKQVIPALTEAIKKLKA